MSINFSEVPIKSIWDFGGNIQKIYLNQFCKFGFVAFFDFAQSDSESVGTGLPDGPQITLN